MPKLTHAMRAKYPDEVVICRNCLEEIGIGEDFYPDDGRKPVTRCGPCFDEELDRRIAAVRSTLVTLESVSQRRELSGHIPVWLP